MVKMPSSVKISTTITTIDELVNSWTNVSTTGGTSP